MFGSNIVEILNVVEQSARINKNLTERILLDAIKWSQQPHLKDLDPTEVEKEYNKWATEYQIKEFGKPISELLKEHTN